MNKAMGVILECDSAEGAPKASRTTLKHATTAGIIKVAIRSEIYKAGALRVEQSEQGHLVECMTYREQSGIESEGRF